ncbi:MAG: GNAT family N-acetyltransferase [Actinomycetota bacterium]|nr:GNAT family N-acetyltransferase [Actinomycetota bacterium]
MRAPVLAEDIAHLEEVAALGWPAPETRRLGGWLLRAGEGWTGRANSVLPLGEPDRPLDEALDEVRDWYARRGLAPRFQLPLPLCAALDAELSDRDWSAYNPTLVRVAEVAAVRAAAPAVAALPIPNLQARPSRRWLAAYHYRGGRELPPVAARIMSAAVDPIFATVEVAGTVAGIARAVVDDGWCGITALEILPDWRRRGVGRHLVGAVVSWAAGRGARRVYLQVAEDNGPAHAMYDRLGFVTSHRYHYRTPR